MTERPVPGRGHQRQGWLKGYRVSLRGERGTEPYGKGNRRPDARTAGYQLDRLDQRGRSKAS